MTLSFAASEARAGQPSVQDVTDRVIEIFIAPDVRNSKRGFPWDRPKRVQFLGHVSEPVREAFREKLAELGEITGEAITYGDDDANVFVIDVQQIRELKAEDLPRRNKSFMKVGSMLPDVHPFVFDAALDSLTCLDEATLRTWADHRMRPSLPKDELQDLIREIAGEALANRLEHSPLCGEQ